jgi:hypothetical protein
MIPMASMVEAILKYSQPAGTPCTRDDRIVGDIGDQRDLPSIAGCPNGDSLCMVGIIIKTHVKYRHETDQQRNVSEHRHRRHTHAIAE